MIAQARRGATAASPPETLAGEARRRAIAAFGTPAEVAAGFSTGLRGALDRRLALIDGRLDPRLGSCLAKAVGIGLGWTAIGVALAGVGGLFDAPSPDNGLRLALAGGLMLALRLAYGLQSRWSVRAKGALRGLPANQRAGLAMRDVVAWPFFVGYAVMLDPDDALKLMGLWLALVVALELAARLGVRAVRAAKPGRTRFTLGCDPDADWRWYVRGVCVSTGLTAALMLAGPGPTALGAALALLLVALTGITMLGRRLALNSGVRNLWGQMYARNTGTEQVWSPAGSTPVRTQVARPR